MTQFGNFVKDPAPFMPTIASVTGGSVVGGISLAPKRTIVESSDPAEIEAQIAKRLKSGGDVAELQNYYYATLPGDGHVSSYAL